MANLTTPACPSPFLSESAYPYTAGFRSGRFCGNLTAGLSCCLPCPLEHWVYSDAFERNTNIAYWFNVPAQVCQVFLLLSFVVLKERYSHRHYLSIGLCVSLVALELSFIIPLGTRPSQCHDAITPNDMYTSLSCAWSGALLEAGAMAGAIWILLRSLWTHLRVVADMKHTALIFWLAQAFGWGLPAMFLAISLPITGVSYRVGTTCFPNQHNAFVTWFGWLLAFASLAALLQCVTTSFCVFIYVRHFFQHSSIGQSDDTSGTGASNVAALTPDADQQPRSASVRLGKRLAWRRVKKVILLQWRSITLSVLVIIETVYFGVVFVAQTRAEREDTVPAKASQIEEWAACLVLSGGNKDECLPYARVLGLSERTVIASLFMSALIGLFTFALMVRGSMLVGWYELIRHPRDTRGGNDPELFVLVSPKSRDSGKQALDHTGILPEPSDPTQQMSVPEAGDVAQRHETTTWFGDDLLGEGEEERKRGARDEVLEDG